MKKESCVRTSLDLPRDLHRRLHEAAARKGTSARKLILESIEDTLDQFQPIRPRKRLSLDVPIVTISGKPLDYTNEELHELIDFP